MQAFGPKDQVLGQVLQRSSPAPIKIVSEAGVANHERGEVKGAKRSIRLHLIIGLAVVIVLAAGLAAGPRPSRYRALIAPGSASSEFQCEKKVQHPTGGVVGEVACATAI